jgi:hypothetical protein
MKPPTLYNITLQSEPSDVPEIIRLRKALKTLLRSYSLRCVSVGQQATDAGESNVGGLPGNVATSLPPSAIGSPADSACSLYPNEQPAPVTAFLSDGEASR